MMATLWKEDQLNPVITDYFTNLFSTEQNILDPDFLNKIDPKVTPDMNDRFIAPFTVDDVRKAMY